MKKSQILNNNNYKTRDELIKENQDLKRKIDKNNPSLFNTSLCSHFLSILLIFRKKLFNIPSNSLLGLNLNFIINQL